MMHGYLAFDAAGKLLVPFRTWRNTNTERAAAELTKTLGFNFPLRWSASHLYQAVIDKEPHVANVAYITTLAGFVHWRLTGKKVLGVGDASGMFPIDAVTHDFDAPMMKHFGKLVAGHKPGLDAAALFPKVLVAGEGRRFADGGGRQAARPPPASFRPASRSARRKATPAPAWWRPTPWPSAPATSAREPRSSPWWCWKSR